MYAVLTFKDETAIRDKWDTRLPDGSTLLQRLLSELEESGITHVILPEQIAFFQSVVEAMGFKAISTDIALGERIGYREIKALFDVSRREDLLLVCMESVVLSSRIRQICKMDGSAVLSISEDIGTDQTVRFDGELPLSPETRELDASDESIDVFPIYKLCASSFPMIFSGETPQAADEGNAVRLSVLRCTENEAFLIGTDSPADLARKMYDMRLREIRIIADPDGALNLLSDLENAGFKSPFMLYEAAEKSVALTRYLQCLIPDRTVELTGCKLDRDALRERAASCGTDCVIAVGGALAQELGGELFGYLKRNNPNGGRIAFISVPSYGCFCIDDCVWLRHTNGEVPNQIVAAAESLLPLTHDGKEWLAGKSLLVFCRCVDLLWGAETPAMNRELARTVAGETKELLLLREWTPTEIRKLMRLLIDAAMAASGVEATIAWAAASALTKERDVPEAFACLAAVGAMAGLLREKMGKAGGKRARRHLADELDELDNLLNCGAGESADVLADLLFASCWRPPEAVEVPPFERYIAAGQLQTTPLPVGTDEFRTRIKAYINNECSVCKKGEELAAELEARGYTTRITGPIHGFAALIKMRRQYLALYAKRMLQDTQMKVFDEFSAVCERLKLSYFLVGETLYGARTEKRLPAFSTTLEVAMRAEDIKKLADAAAEFDPDFSFVSCWNSESCYDLPARLTYRGSELFSNYNLYAPNENHEVGITIYPLAAAKGAGGAERKRFKAAQMIRLMIWHKRGIHHRPFGWKGLIAIRLCKLLSLDMLFRWQKKLFFAYGTGNSFLCDCDRDYDVSLIDGAAAFPPEQVELEGRVAFAPRREFFQFGPEQAMNRLKAKQNNLLMPGSYKLFITKQDEYFLSEPPKTIPAEPRLRNLLIGRLKKSLAAFRKRFADRWKRDIKPLVKSWLRAQFVRVTGSIRGMGLCLTKRSKRLKSYRNRYAGQRCFLIGNGPSLCAEDLDKLQNEITFGCNFIHKIYPQTDWRPTFHFLSDSGTVRTASWDLVQNQDESKTTFFIRDYTWKFMYVKPKDAVLVPYISLKKYKVHGNFLAYHYISHATVMSMMLEAAFYMGFREIYLIGVDGTTSSGKGGNFVKNYFSDQQRAQLDKMKRRAIKNYDVLQRRRELAERQNAVYQKLREYAEKHDIKIYNAGRNSALEVFERADFDAVLSEGR